MVVFLRAKKKEYIELHLRGQSSMSYPGAHYVTMYRDDLDKLYESLAELIEFLDSEPTCRTWEVSTHGS